MLENPKIDFAVAVLLNLLLIYYAYRIFFGY